MAKEPQKLRRVVIKEELVALTGDFLNAIILQQLLFWSERVKDFDIFILEERKRSEKSGTPINMQPTRGWIYKKADELSEETMLGLAPGNIRNRIKKLEAQGYIMSRLNPEHKWDKTYQYRVDLLKIQRDLLKKGYFLEGYKINLDDIFDKADLMKAEIVPSNDGTSVSEIRINETDIRINESLIRDNETEIRKNETEIRKNETENRDVETAIRNSEIENRITKTVNRTDENVKAIPETTTKITTKNIVVDDVGDNPPGDTTQLVQKIIDSFREAAGGYELSPGDVETYLKLWSYDYILEKIQIVKKSKIDDSVMGFFISALKNNYPLPSPKKGLRVKRKDNPPPNPPDNTQSERKKALIKKLYLT